MHALWMVLAAFFFATMAVGIKFASADFGTMELVIVRMDSRFVVSGAKFAKLTNWQGAAI